MRSAWENASCWRLFVRKSERQHGRKCCERSDGAVKGQPMFWLGTVRFFSFALCVKERVGRSFVGSEVATVLSGTVRFEVVDGCLVSSMGAE